MDLWNLEPVTLPPALHVVRREVREFLAEEAVAGRLVPHCDQWLAGWDPAFSRRLGARGWIGMHPRPARARRGAGRPVAAAHREAVSLPSHRGRPVRDAVCIAGAPMPLN